jgi:N6-adenosine-specific RNA methylase IME4
MFEGPSIELFARQQRRKWMGWGNQLERFEAAA